MGDTINTDSSRVILDTLWYNADQAVRKAKGKVDTFNRFKASYLEIISNQNKTVKEIHTQSEDKQRTITQRWYVDIYEKGDPSPRKMVGTGVTGDTGPNVGDVDYYDKILKKIEEALKEINDYLDDAEKDYQENIEGALDDIVDNDEESSDSAGYSSSIENPSSGGSSGSSGYSNSIENPSSGGSSGSSGYSNSIENPSSGGNSDSSGYSSSIDNPSSGGSSGSYGYTSLDMAGQAVSDFGSKTFENSSTEKNSAIDKVKQTATDSISNTFKNSSTEKKSSVEKNVDNIISIDNTSDSSSSTSSDASIQTAEETQKQVTDTIVTPVDTATGSEYEAIPKTGLEGKKSSNVQLIPIAVGAALGAAGVTAKKLQKKDSKNDEKDNKDKD